MTLTELAVEVRMNLCIDHARFIDGEDDANEEQELRCKIVRLNDWLWKRQQREWKE